jgi:methionyl-tRNA formyltransferase
MRLLFVILSSISCTVGLVRHSMWRAQRLACVGTCNFRSSRLFATGAGAGLLSKKRIVFLGTPAVAAESLQVLHDAAEKGSSGCLFEVVAVVSQPISGTKKKPSPVQVTAGKLGLLTLCPETAKDPEFLSQLEKLDVDLCVTAAYGNYLPKRFLSIPKFGTVNIHPSLLPKYRGAAPVQRCLENGDSETGVSVLYTVQKMDAGPIIAQEPYKLNGQEKAPTVLSDCFKLGTAALINALPSIFNGTMKGTPQDDTAKTEAPKLTAEDSVIDFGQLTAAQVHNKCRGFAEWPGTIGTFQIGAEDGTNPAVGIKLVTTVVLDGQPGAAECTREVSVVKHKVNGKDVPVLRVVCHDGSVLGIVEVLPPSRRVMNVQDFINGLKGDRSIRWVTPISAAGVTSAPV